MGEVLWELSGWKFWGIFDVSYVATSQVENPNREIRLSYLMTPPLVLSSSLHDLFPFFFLIGSFWYCLV